MPPPFPQFSNSLFREDLEHVLAHTRDFWEEVRGQRLFITGGTGFFGIWLVESFLWAHEQLGLEAQAVVLSRDPRAFCRKMPHLAGHPALSLQAGDVRTFEFPEGRFSHVIHAATEKFDPASDADRFAVFERDIQGTRRTLDFARHCGAKGFLLTSSGAVYGRQPPELSHTPEDYRGAPDTMNADAVYGHAKRVSELLCAMHFRQCGLETKIARCFAFAGPHLPLDAHFAVGNFIRDGLRGGPIVVKGDGAPQRSYLYAADLAIWLWTVLFRGRSCRPYNVGSADAVSIAGLAHAVAAAFEPSPAVKIAGTPVPGKPAERYVPDCRRASEELDLRPRVDLAESIRRTVSWHSKRVPRR